MIMKAPSITIYSGSQLLFPDSSKLSGRKRYTKGVAVSLPTSLLERVDRDAEISCDTRSGRVAEILRQHYISTSGEEQQ